jgi:YD repeat-containing protein
VSVRNAAGLVHRFARVAGRSRNDAPLAEIRDADGNSVRLYYDDYGRLARIVDCAGRAIEMIHDEAGRVVALTAPHPDVPGQRIYLARYAYDHAGDLTTVWDALGQPASYAYQHHLLARETDRNGLSFYFAYDAFGQHGKCVRTWGDGGIYDHKLAYDIDGNITVVEDSLGYRTAYFHDGAVVVKTVDALGNTTEKEYDDNRRVVSETDALGRKSSYAYDERGNLAAMEGPDGATVRFENGRHDRPERGIDAMGGEWLWIREPSGRLLERRDPLGNVTKYHYQGIRLVGLTDPGGGRTAIEHDESGNPCAVVTADGAVTRFAYDFHGRLTTVTDALGNVERRQFDLLDRLSRIDEVNGNTRVFSYDPEGSVVRVKDELHDVSYGYRGMGRLVSRSEAGTTVSFEYDTEEQLVAVVNEHGSIYRFELGPTGEVVAESGFDGLLRRYSHDASGRVVRVERPRGARSLGEAENSADHRVTEYHYDAADRVTRVVHSDGRVHQFAYRADGQMTAAISPDAFWVESEFDALGSRVRTRSSMGADHRVGRNAVGDVVGIHDLENGYETRFQRDRLGRELERSLPGGLRSRWQRDRAGRPLQHTVEGPANTLRAVAFQWDSGTRLRRLINAASGTIAYGYDGLGALASAKYPDQSFELRMPDAVGNLFKTQERSDRRYGAAGQLLAARTP